MQTYPTTGPVTLALQIGAGSAEVTTTSEQTASVEVTALDDTDACRQAVLQTQVSMIKDQLTVATPDCRPWLLRRAPRIAIVVRIPQGSRMHLRTAAADTRCSGSYDTVTIASGSADVSLEAVTGSLSAKSGSGDLRFGQVDGDMVVRSGSGDVSIERTSAAGKVTVASGDITIGSATGNLAVASASGQVAVAEAGPGELSVKTASGKVRIGVLAGTRTWLNITSVAGRTNTDLTMTGNTSDSADPVADTGTGTGTERSERPTLLLKVHTASGNIDVVRAESTGAGQM